MSFSGPGYDAPSQVPQPWSVPNDCACGCAAPLVKLEVGYDEAEMPLFGYEPFIEPEGEVVRYRTMTLSYLYSGFGGVQYIPSSPYDWSTSWTGGWVAVGGYSEEGFFFMQSADGVRTVTRETDSGPQSDALEAYLPNPDASTFTWATRPVGEYHGVSDPTSFGGEMPIDIATTENTRTETNHQHGNVTEDEYSVSWDWTIATVVSYSDPYSPDDLRGKLLELLESFDELDPMPWARKAEWGGCRPGGGHASCVASYDNPIGPAEERKDEAQDDVDEIEGLIADSRDDIESSEEELEGAILDYEASLVSENEARIEFAKASRSLSTWTRRKLENPDDSSVEAERLAAVARVGSAQSALDDAVMESGVKGGAVSLIQVALRSQRNTLAQRLDTLRLRSVELGGRSEQLNFLHGNKAAVQTGFPAILKTAFGWLPSFPPRQVSWWGRSGYNASSGRFNGGMKARRGRYRFRVTIQLARQEDTSVTVKWSEVFFPQAMESPAVENKEVIVTVPAGETEAWSEWIEVPVPESRGRVCIYGPGDQGLAVRFFNPARRSAIGRKAGFAAYDGSSRVFRREDSTGKFSAWQAYNATSRAGEYVPASSGMSAVPLGRRSRPTPIYKEFSDTSGAIQNAASRSWDAGAHVLALSLEHTTSQLISEVQAGVSPSIGSTQTWWGSDISSEIKDVAIKYLAPDEATYIESKFQTTLQVGRANDANTVLTFNFEDESIGIEWDRETTNLDNGNVDTAGAERSVTVAGYNSWLDYQYDPNSQQGNLSELLAEGVPGASNRMIRLVGLRSDTRSYFVLRDPVASFKEG